LTDTAKYTVADGLTLFAEDLAHVDAVLGDAAEDLRGARVFITGASGFFGIWLTEALLYIGHQRALDLELVLLSRDPDRFLEGRGRHLRHWPNVTLVAGDIADLAITDTRITHILHLASESNVDGRSDWPGRHLNAVLEGTSRVLDLSLRTNAKSTLLTSSGAVYLNENAGPHPLSREGFGDIAEVLGEKNVYGQAKRTMELLGAISAATHGHRVLIARCFAFVGPYLPLDANYAVGNFLRDAMAGRQIVVNGDGTPLRSYLYAADLAGQLLRLLVLGRSGVPYNVGGAETVSIAELASLVVELSGSSAGVDIRQTPVPGAIPSAYAPDVFRIHKELSLVSPIGLKQAIVRTLAWHRGRV